MAIRFMLGTTKPGEEDPATRILKTPLEEGTLKTLFTTLSKRHPDLAPVLEDATNQDDLEIYVNDHKLQSEEGERYRLRDGDTVALLLKQPDF